MTEFAWYNNIYLFAHVADILDVMVESSALTSVFPGVSICAPTIIALLPIPSWRDKYLVVTLSPEVPPFTLLCLPRGSLLPTFEPFPRHLSTWGHLKKIGLDINATVFYQAHPPEHAQWHYGQKGFLAVRTFSSYSNTMLCQQVLQEGSSVLTLLSTFVTSVECVLAPLLLVFDALALFRERKVTKGTVVELMVALVDTSQVTDQVFHSCIPNLRRAEIWKFFKNVHLMAVMAFQPIFHNNIQTWLRVASAKKVVKGKAAFSGIDQPVRYVIISDEKFCPFIPLFHYGWGCLSASGLSLLFGGAVILLTPILLFTCFLVIDKFIIGIFIVIICLAISVLLQFLFYLNFLFRVCRIWSACIESNTFEYFFDSTVSRKEGIMLETLLYKDRIWRFSSFLV